MSQLCIQFAVTFIGIQVIQNNLVEIFLPSVSLCYLQTVNLYNSAQCLTAVIIFIFNMLLISCVDSPEYLTNTV